MQPQLHHHRDSQLGEGGSAAPTPGLVHLPFDLRGVVDRKPGSIQTTQPQPMIKRIRMLFRIGLGRQRRGHQQLEDFPRQARAALRQGAVGNLPTRQLLHMLGQRASSGDGVKDHSLHQFVGRDPRRPSTLHVTSFQHSPDHGRGQQLGTQILEDSTGRRRYISHPKVNGSLWLNVQGKNCLVRTTCASIHVSKTTPIRKRLWA